MSFTFETDNRPELYARKCHLPRHSGRGGEEIHREHGTIQKALLRPQRLLQKQRQQERHNLIQLHMGEKPQP